jgi:outer membrane protein
MERVRVRLCEALCATVLLTATTVRAGELLVSPEPASGWIITLGAQLQAQPKFIGSDAFSPGGAPILSIRRVGESDPFAAPDDNLDYTIFGNERFRIGPVAAIDDGRYLADDRRLAGLGKVPWGVEAGVFGEFWPIVGRLRTRVEVRYGFGYQDVVADFGADWVERIGRFTLSGGPRATLADSTYMRRYFGVTPSQAAASGQLTPFTPGGGVRSVGIEAVAAYQLTDAWKTFVFGRYDRLVGDAAKSPIIAKFEARDLFTVGLGFTYSFVTGGAGLRSGFF